MGGAPECEVTDHTSTDHTPTDHTPTDHTVIGQPTADHPPAEVLERVLAEIKAVIVGQDHLVERMLVAFLAGGHCLIEAGPGVAKTLAARTLATVAGGSFTRIQFTPDLVPSDILGTRVYRPSGEGFDIEYGPVMANVVLADGINRGPAKVQAALLEVMAQRRVSISGVARRVPDPFLVLATQDPVESDGVDELTGARRDRFLLKIVVGYPGEADELGILYRMSAHQPTARRLLAPDDLITLRRLTTDVFVHHAIAEYAVRLVLGTRDPAAFGAPDLRRQLARGASPRATLGLVAAARAIALLRGRDHVLPEDVRDLAVDVIAHRLVPSRDAVTSGAPMASIVEQLVAVVPLPQVAPAQAIDYQGRAA